MDINIFKRDNLDLDAWETLTGQGSFFHTYRWVDICLAGISRKSEAVFICGFDNNHLVAGLPAVVISRAGFKSFLSLPYGTYGSVLFETGMDNHKKQQFLDCVSDFIRERNFSLVEIIDFQASCRKLSIAGMEMTNCFTHILELKEGNEYQPAEGRVERHIKSGQKKQVEIELVNDIHKLEEFYNLYLQTEERHGRTHPVYGKSFFESIYRIIGDSDSLYWTAAIYDNTMIASQINFIHADTLFYWQGVMDYGKREYKPAYLLMNNAINKAVDMGLKRVNLGASPQNADGLIDFKESWGAKRVEYIKYIKKSLLHRLVGW